jgi:hypothetical protein
MRSNREHHCRRLVTAVVLGVLASAAGTSQLVSAQVAPPLEPPMSLVLEETVRGDLVMAGNSNLLAAGGWAGTSAADVDGDRSRICIGRVGRPGTLCADNSSSATVDLPPGAAVIEARLYVSTAVSESVGPLRVRLAGPGDTAYSDAGLATPEVPKVGEASGGDLRAVHRQAIWDVTDFIARRGPGQYTVADIVNERAGPWLPYASWGIVVAYELDPANEALVSAQPPEVQQRFALRTLSWHDGLAMASGAPLEVEVGGFTIPADRRVFAKSFHLIAHAGAPGFENVSFEGGPLGNNATPGDAAAPTGVVIGTDPACNTIVDVLNDTICSLGTPVQTKAPGPLDYRSSADGVTPSSTSAVDMDVTRIPDRYLLPGMTSATVSVDVVGDGTVAAGVIAVSVDQSVVAP